MRDQIVRRPPLGWLAGGILLGLVQVAAVGLKSPLGVSTQFVVADTQVLREVAPDYVAAHPLISSKTYAEPGYGWWLDVGIVLGALLAAFATKRFRVSAMPAWWRVNRGESIGRRLATAFVGGFLILLGARFAHGCTSGQFASGWTQLSLAAVPFTIALFGAAMVTARIVHPKAPQIDEGGQ